MVELKTINHIFEKCWTKAQIREKLSTYTQDEKDIGLTGLLNQGEEEEYKRSIRMRDDFKNQISLYTKLYGDEYTLGKGKAHQRKLDKVNERIFQYERRIIEGYTPPVRSVPNVDISRFKEDVQDKVNEGMGVLEKKQVDSQEKINFNELQINGLTEWWGAGHWEINSSIYNGEHWNGLSSDERRVRTPILKAKKQGITSAINKTDGLVEDMTLYRGEKHFDVTLVPGDRIQLKGYTSMTFSKKVAQGFKGDNGYLMKYLMPTGTKGVCGNSDMVNNAHKQEHEYLTGRDTGGTIVDIDYDNHEVYVLID